MSYVRFKNTVKERPMGLLKPKVSLLFHERIILKKKQNLILASKFQPKKKKDISIKMDGLFGMKG